MSKLVLLLLSLAAITAQADPLGEEVAALKIKFPEGRQLSSNDLRVVVELAHRAGMNRVAVINPAASQWGEPMLTILAAERVRGRRTVQESLSVRNEEWLTASSPPRDGASKLGKFVTYGSPTPSTLHLATFTINGKSTQLECSTDTDLAEADQIFTALLAGQIEYSTSDAKTRAAAMKFTAPTFISIRAGEVRIGFRNDDPWCFDSIKGKYNSDKLVVEKAMTACA